MALLELLLDRGLRHPIVDVLVGGDHAEDEVRGDLGVLGHLFARLRRSLAEHHQLVEHRGRTHRQAVEPLDTGAELVQIFGHATQLRDRAVEEVPIDDDTHQWSHAFRVSGSRRRPSFLPHGPPRCLSPRAGSTPHQPCGGRSTVCSRSSTARPTCRVVTPRTTTAPSPTSCGSCGRSGCSRPSGWWTTVPLVDPRSMTTARPGCSWTVRWVLDTLSSDTASSASACSPGRGRGSRPSSVVPVASSRPSPSRTLRARGSAGAAAAAGAAARSGAVPP